MAIVYFDIFLIILDCKISRKRWYLFVFVAKITTGLSYLFSRKICYRLTQESTYMKKLQA